MLRNMEFSYKQKKIWVAGHNGMVGSALYKRFQNEKCDLLTVPKKELDLTNALLGDEWIKLNKPQVVLL